MVFHCGERLYCVSWLRVDLSMWSAGREKVTRNIAWAEAAILLALSRFDRVRLAIGCMSVGGFCSVATLGGATTTLGSVATPLELLAELRSPLEVLLGVRFRWSVEELAWCRVLAC